MPAQGMGEVASLRASPSPLPVGLDRGETNSFGRWSGLGMMMALDRAVSEPRTRPTSRPFFGESGVAWSLGYDIGNGIACDRREDAPISVAFRWAKA